MQAKIHARSDYRNLNGRVLPVVEIFISPFSKKKKRITCQIYAHEFGTYIRIDFYGDEATVIKNKSSRTKKGGRRE